MRINHDLPKTSKRELIYQSENDFIERVIYNITPSPNEPREIFQGEYNFGGHTMPCIGIKSHGIIKWFCAIYMIENCREVINR